jgi:sterol desaturase/sphingolipid hydroxylase (fatty acid hydroxylase superfamily)
MSILEKCEAVIQQYDFSNIVTGLITLAFCFVLELFALPFKQTSIYKLLHPNKSVATDLILAPMYILGIFSIMKAIVFFEARIPSVNLHVSNYIQSSWLQLFIYIIVIDFLNYWIHRIHHAIEFLWQIHKFHHSAVDFVLITGNRIHPLERVVQNLVVFIPLRLLGTPVETYLLITVMINIIEGMQHSMVNWDLGWVGRNIIFSPVGHRIHHSKEQEHWDTNYGNIFVFWDKMFGTYYHGKKINTEIGVSENWFNRRGIFYDLIYSTYQSAKEFLKSLTSGRWKAGQR